MTNPTPPTDALPRGGRNDALVWEVEIPILEPHYGVDDVPPPGETLLYAVQHTLVDISPYVLPLVVAGAVGYSGAQAAAMISASLVMMGLFTFINATWGHRLPSVMGPSATDTGAMATAGSIFGAPAMWMAGFIGGLCEAALGASGALDRLRRYLPPYVCGMVVLTIGVALARVAGGWVFQDPRPRMLGLCGVTALSIVALTVVGHRIGRRVGGLLSRGSILFSLLLTGVGGATLLGLADFSPLAEAPWVRLPQLFLFGAPFGLAGGGDEMAWTLVGGAVFGVLIGYLGSVAESIGDYAGVCAVSKIPYRVRHIHRGITVEGIASAVAPLFGAIPLTTYSQNTGLLATTRVASRRVVQVAAVLLLLYGLSPKVGALLILIPRPVVGVVFLVVCGMIATAGLQLLAAGERDEAYFLTTSITLIVAITVPLVAPAQGEWFGGLPPALRLVLSNSVVLAVTLGVGLNALFGGVLRQS